VSNPRTPPLQPRSPARCGFTLLELLLVLGLVALVATLAVPAWFERSEVTLHNAADLLQRDLEVARALAASGSGPLQVRFSSDGYEVTRADGSGLVHPRTGQAFRRSYARDAIFEGVAVRSVRIAGGPPLSFDAAGYASGRTLVELTFGGDAVVIEVTAPEGAARQLGADRPN
jgi:type II secretion system protein H